jgi:hypothetical protein
MPVTLESRTRRMQVFHLPHEVCCRDRCSCAEAVVFVVAEHPRTGERARKRVVKRVPGSITFLARERKPDLPAALLELAQVKAAIGRGYLRIVAQTPEVCAPASEATAAAVGPGPVASPAPGQPTAIAAQAHASPAPGSVEPQRASEARGPGATGPAVPAPLSTSSSPPAPNSSAHAAAPAPATPPPGKEA